MELVIFTCLPLYPCYPLDMVGEEKSVAPTHNPNCDPYAVQPVASRNTNYAVCYKKWFLLIHIPYKKINNLYVVIIQGVRMKCIKNKIIISQKTCILHIYGLHHYKGQLSKYFLGIYVSVNLYVGSLGGTTNMQTIFDLRSMFCVTVTTASLMRAFKCWRSLILTW
jgi:hypothetical protein